MQPGTMLTDRLTGKSVMFVRYLNKEESLMLVNYDGKGEITVTREEIK